MEMFERTRVWGKIMVCKLILGAMAILLLTAGNSVIAETNNETLGDGELMEIEFYGIAVELHQPEGLMGAPTYWTLEGVSTFASRVEPCSEQINVTIRQSLAPPWGEADADVQPGDLVEAYGSYKEDEEGCSVTLHGSEDYYLKKLATSIKFQGTAAKLNQPGPGVAGGSTRWTVDNISVLEGEVEPCSQVMEVAVAQAIPVPWGQVDWEVEEGDLVEVYGAYYQEDDRCWVELWGSNSYYFKKASSN
jgi:hypothetical protein